MTDPYVYPGTDVLRNLRGLRDADQLARWETREVKFAIDSMADHVAATRKPDEKAFRDIHKLLFGAVYDWAGGTRSVDIAKNDTYFCRAQYVDREMTARFALLGAEKYLVGLAAAAFAARAAEHICEINAIHPFREGNGRTMVVYLRQLAQYAGHDLDLTRFARDPWIAASRAGMLGDYGPKTAVISAALVPA